ncbi:Uncharacterised protein [Bacteroides salyersiae]|nr:Uncharacterised protein [Bacteroides salyersiae]
MVKLAEKALADSCGLFFPKLKLIKRLVAAVRALFIKLKSTIILPTMLYTPKSSTPNVSNTIREVYREMPINRNILKYNRRVFLAIRLLSIIFFSNDK